MLTLRCNVLFDIKVTYNKGFLIYFIFPFIFLENIKKSNKKKYY